MDFDVIFIGSGHANWHAAVTLKQAGKRLPLLKKTWLAELVPTMVAMPRLLWTGRFNLLNS